MTDSVRYILRCVTFSCIIVLFEVGYNTIFKSVKPLTDYLLHVVIFCLALFAVDYVVNLWKSHRAKRVEKAEK